MKAMRAYRWFGVSGTVFCVTVLLGWIFLCGSSPAFAAAGGEGHGTPPEKLWDLLYRAMAFAVLFVVLFWVLRKPIPKFLSNRRASIQNELAELQAKKGETEKLLQELRRRVTDIESEREFIIAEYIKEGEAEKAKILEQARIAGNRIREQAGWAIAQEVKDAKLRLQSEIADLASAMAEDVIRKNIREEDQQRLMEEYIEKVVERA